MNLFVMIKNKTNIELNIFCFRSYILVMYWCRIIFSNVQIWVLILSCWLNLFGTHASPQISNNLDLPLTPNIWFWSLSISPRLISCTREPLVLYSTISTNHRNIHPSDLFYHIIFLLFYLLGLFLYIQSINQVINHLVMKFSADKSAH